MKKDSFKSRVNPELVKYEKPVVKEETENETISIHQLQNGCKAIVRKPKLTEEEEKKKQERLKLDMANYTMDVLNDYQEADRKESIEKKEGE